VAWGSPSSPKRSFIQAVMVKIPLCLPSTSHLQVPCHTLCLTCRGTHTYGRKRERERERERGEMRTQHVVTNGVRPGSSGGTHPFGRQDTCAWGGLGFRADCGMESSTFPILVQVSNDFVGHPNLSPSTLLAAASWNLCSQGDPATFQPDRCW
jgi:hypothetical protein